MTTIPAEDRARGLMAGLLLGDALGEGETTGPLRGTCLAQLACFTLEGMIRASVRYAHRGICSPPGVVWRAYQRWGAVQGLGAEVQLDGWLYQVAPLGARRGSAPATVGALRAGDMGTRGGPVNGSAGHHALTRPLPVALFAGTLADPVEMAMDVAALTHGAAEAWRAAGEGAAMAARALSARSWAEVLEGGTVGGPPGTAGAALAAGVEALRRKPGRAEVLDAIGVARGLGGPGAATFAGALAGAKHGYVALPQAELGRLEIGWVADKLARDAVTEQTSAPSGSEYEPAADGSWWTLYPGW